MYEVSKQLIKFVISGVIAVLTDFIVYYGLGALPFDIEYSIGLGFHLNDLYKALGFLFGTTVTYNLNKFWTWRKTDTDNSRLGKFAVLYAISFIINIGVNKYALQYMPDNEFMLMIKRFDETAKQLFALKIDKLAAFLIATIASTIVNFIGQKTWVFKSKEED